MSAITVMALLDNLFARWAASLGRWVASSAATAKHGVHSVEKSVDFGDKNVDSVEKNVDIARPPANSGVANSFVLFKLTMLWVVGNV